jgi:uncharacterized membrane protein
VIDLDAQHERTFSIVLMTSDPDGESALKETFQKMQNEFQNASFGVSVKEKRLVPFEVALDITVKVASGVTVALVLKLLERLWKEFQKNKVTPQTQPVDGIQNKAEQYMRSIGVVKFKTLERKDTGPYVTFIFKDNDGAKHKLIVTSFDLKIVHYQKKA